MFDFSNESEEFHIQNKVLLEGDFLWFNRFFLKIMEGSVFDVGWHHRLICETLVKVFSGEITRLIINIPPRHSKTQLAVIGFISWCLARKPRSVFLHITGSDKLCLKNSTKIRDIILSCEYQKYWGLVELKQDTRSKGLWVTNKKAEVNCSSIGGQVVGFGAGRLDDGFSGGIVLDDLLKPGSAFSVAERTRINDLIVSSIDSRLATSKTPVIMIMQRLHADDPTGFLLSGGSGEKWHWLSIPGVGNGEPQETPREFTHAIPIKYKPYTGSLWEKRRTLEKFKIMRKKTPYVFNSQVQQAPDSVADGMFSVNFNEYDDIPENTENIKCYVDTSQGQNENNDRTTYTVAGRIPSINRKLLVILDVFNGYYDINQKFAICDKIWKKWGLPRGGKKSLVSFYVEPKDMGLSLQQYLQGENIPTQTPDSERTKMSKVQRGATCMHEISSGIIYLPRYEPWKDACIYEVAHFNENMTHKFDDFCDTLFDAIRDQIHGIQGQISLLEHL